MVRVPSPDDNKILITSSTIIEGEKIDVAFLLLHASYFHTEKDGTTNRVGVSDSQQTELLEKVQTELNRFVKKWSKS